jgi:hypothetical protein
MISRKERKLMNDYEEVEFGVNPAELFIAGTLSIAK